MGLITGRIQDVAGLTWPCINLDQDKILIKYVAIWIKRKKFSHLKDCPKNGEERTAYTNSRLRTILERRISYKISHTDHKYCSQSGVAMDMVFHVDGRPIESVSYTHPPSPRDRQKSRMPSSA